MKIADIALNIFLGKSGEIKHICIHTLKKFLKCLFLLAHSEAQSHDLIKNESAITKAITY